MHTLHARGAVLGALYPHQSDTVILSDWNSAPFATTEFQPYENEDADIDMSAKIVGHLGDVHVVPSSVLPWQNEWGNPKAWRHTFDVIHSRMRRHATAGLQAFTVLYFYHPPVLEWSGLWVLSSEKLDRREYLELATAIHTHYYGTLTPFFHQPE